MLTVFRDQPFRLLADERGATAIEYAFIVLLIGIAVIGALTALGTSLAGFFEVPANALNSAD
ncbi:MAG: Flp family type IVb pilin [Rhodospirillales bacterium]|nr:Flp family type IVb pilin [Rhodospirillales bacterium]